MPSNARAISILLLGVCLAVLGGCGATHDDKAPARAAARHTSARTARVAAAGDATRTTQTPAPPVASRPLPRGVVALVGAIAITKQELEHWTGVEAIALQSGSPRETRSLPAGGRASLQRKALQTLIVHYWVREEAARTGVALTSGEVDGMLRLWFPSKSAFRRHLARTGLHASDERLLVEDLLLPEKWHRTVLPVYARLRRNTAPETIRQSGEVDAEVSKLTQSMTRRWTPRTQCREGYVVRFCGDYRE
jgi:hypothetical protein